ncbi:MAG: hypothetical protein IKC01_06705 [Clostridia bacterium]|nr:hypothetical protein [Clostridia bacterium]
MVRYCEKCREIHDAGDMCPKYKEQLKKHPEWLAEAADFANVAAQERLVSTQALDSVCKVVNKISGSELSFEGTKQAARDIQVFAKLNSDSFRNSGQFANAQAASETLKNGSEGFQRYLKGRLNGTGQEIDWLRSQQGKFSGILKKSTLPDGNTVGYDGETINRFTGKVIERTSVKAAEGSSGLYTNAKDIVEALEKGTLNPKDAVTGVKGTKEAVAKALEKRVSEAAASGDTNLANKLTQAKDTLKINEMGTMDSTKESTDRLLEKIKNGNANTTITPDLVAQKAAQGAVVGAAVSLTISSITNYIKYKNGEITRDEAFRDVGEDSVKGVITGGAMGVITLFLPGGAIGFVAGVAIGMYISEVTGNFLDEVFGKGAYEQILHACGYVSGTAKNVVDMISQFGESVENINKYNTQSTQIQNSIVKNQKINRKTLDEINGLLEDF